MNDPFINWEEIKNLDIKAPSFRLIHDNLSIRLEFKSDCYMRRYYMWTNLFIDVDYLTQLLNLLCTGLSNNDYIHLFQINVYQ